MAVRPLLSTGEVEVAAARKVSSPEVIAVESAFRRSASDMRAKAARTSIEADYVERGSPNCRRSRCSTNSEQAL